MHRLSALLLCSLCAAPALLPWDGSPLTGAVEQRPDEMLRAAACLPEGWRLEEIARAALPPACPGATYVLAYKRIANDRPVRVDYCLVLTHLPDDGGERWDLIRLARNPGDRDARRAEWHRVEVHYMPYQGWPEGAWVWHMECFPKRPSSQAVYRFADLCGWKFTVDGDWRLLDAKVCEDTWRAIFGEGPSRDFCRGLSRPGTGP
jgi:hypothetical protein